MQKKKEGKKMKSYDFLYSWVYRFNPEKMSILLKVVFRFKVILIKIKLMFFK